MAEVAAVSAAADAESLRRFLDASPLVGSREMTFVAGRAADAAAVAAMVKALDTTKTWWSFREWTDAMRLVEGIAGVPRSEGAAGDEARFVTGRWFGEGGDLEVWRAGAGFGWRWLGPPGVSPPGEPSSDFFAERGGEVRLRRVEGRRALLWDRSDARVATADAETMTLLPMDGRKALRYAAYYDRGSVAAVWYRAIVDVPLVAAGSRERENDG